MKIVFGTGHRDPKDVGVVFDDMVELAKDELRIEDPRIAICGMASGFDLAFGLAAKELEIELWCFRPWAGHTPRKGEEHIYMDLLGYCRVHKMANASISYPGPWVYQDRNVLMVQHATSGIALWNGKQSGGTWNCIKYANENDTPVVNLMINVYHGARKSL